MRTPLPPALEWDSKLETGFHDIDEQHRRIIERMSTLLEAIEEGRSGEVIVNLADFLVDYTSRHFSTEEAIMLALGYPDYEAHKRKHDTFIIQMVRVMSQVSDKNHRHEALSEIGSKVVAWILSHFEHTDSAMASWIRAQSESQSTR